jgi:hypothetical protein
MVSGRQFDTPPAETLPSFHARVERILSQMRNFCAERPAPHGVRPGSIAPRRHSR